jgi:hypothetical protein
VAQAAFAQAIVPDPTLTPGGGVSTRRASPQQDNVAVALAATAQGPEAVNNTRLQPDQALAMLVDGVLISRAIRSRELLMNEISFPSIGVRLFQSSIAAWCWGDSFASW